MKVYFIGAHSTGKTTLARYVADKYKLPFLNEIARTILAEKELKLDELRTNLDLVDSYQTEVFYRQIKEEQSKKHFVSDRSFDNLAYAAQHSRVTALLASETIFKHYIETLKDPNVIMFFVRPTKATLRGDGVREHITWEGVIAIDAMIKLLLEMFGLRYFQISTDSMQERVSFIDSVLSIIK